jgi:hypothetical protein
MQLLRDEDHPPPAALELKGGFPVIARLAARWFIPPVRFP